MGSAEERVRVETYWASSPNNKLTIVNNESINKLEDVHGQHRKMENSQIDYTLLIGRHLMNRYTDVGSDHNLVLMKSQLSLKKKRFDTKGGHRIFKRLRMIAKLKDCTKACIVQMLLNFMLKLEWVTLKKNVNWLESKYQKHRYHVWEDRTSYKLWITEDIINITKERRTWLLLRDLALDVGNTIAR